MEMYTLGHTLMTKGNKERILEKRGNSKLLVCTVFSFQFLVYSYSWIIMEL